MTAFDHFPPKQTNDTHGIGEVRVNLHGHFQTFHTFLNQIFPFFTPALEGALGDFPLPQFLGLEPLSWGG